MDISKLILLGGLGRSGTSITGKLVATALETIYFFEPPVPAYLLERARSFDDKEEWKRLFDVAVKKDLVKGALAGRNINLNPHDDSSVYGYMTKSNINKLHSKTYTQFEIIDKAKSVNVIIKTLDNIRNFDILSEIYPKVKGIIMVRNPKETFNSLYRKHWFSDALLDLSHPDSARDFQKYKGYRVPLFIQKESLKKQWIKHSEMERIAFFYTWHYERFLKMAKMNNLCFISYDHFVRNPHQDMLMIFNWLGLQEGELTQKVVSGIKPSKNSGMEYVVDVPESLSKQMTQSFQKLKDKCINL